MPDAEQEQKEQGGSRSSRSSTSSRSRRRFLRLEDEHDNVAGGCHATK